MAMLTSITTSQRSQKATYKRTFYANTLLWTNAKPQISLHHTVPEHRSLMGGQDEKWVHLWRQAVQVSHSNENHAWDIFFSPPWTTAKYRLERTLWTHYALRQWSRRLSNSLNNISRQITNSATGRILAACKTDTSTSQRNKDKCIFKWTPVCVTGCLLHRHNS